MKLSKEGFIYLTYGLNGYWIHKYNIIMDKLITTFKLGGWCNMGNKEINISICKWNDVASVNRKRTSET